MGSVVGFGGIFLRAKDPKALYAWYEQHLGLKNEGGAHGFPPPVERGQVIVSFFKQESDYFPPEQKAMLNLIVDDLDEVLDRLIGAGVPVDPKRDTYDFGKFGWFSDPEGNCVELWQPIESE